MEVTINIGGLIDFVLLDKVSDDDATVIGLSRVAYVTRRDPAHIFLTAATWHDAAYLKGSEFQKLMSRATVDATFLHMMLLTAMGDEDLTHEAIQLYLIVRRFAGKAWEGGL